MWSHECWVDGTAPCLLCHCSFHPERSWPSLLPGHCWLAHAQPAVNEDPQAFKAEQLPSQALPSPYILGSSQTLIFFHKAIKLVRRDLSLVNPYHWFQLPPSLSCLQESVQKKLLPLFS